MQVSETTNTYFDAEAERARLIADARVVRLRNLPHAFDGDEPAGLRVGARTVAESDDLARVDDLFTDAEGSHGEEWGEMAREVAAEEAQAILAGNERRASAIWRRVQAAHALKALRRPVPVAFGPTPAPHGLITRLLAALAALAATVAAFAAPRRIAPPRALALLVSARLVHGPPAAA